PCLCTLRKAYKDVHNSFSSPIRVQHLQRLLTSANPIHSHRLGGFRTKHDSRAKHGSRAKHDSRMKHTTRDLQASIPDGHATPTDQIRHVILDGPTNRNITTTIIIIATTTTRRTPGRR
ncbi:hypothetical protein LTR66_006874, partial [Elasticomyces elasticus]